jgi:hypothetical protein
VAGNPLTLDAGLVIPKLTVTGDINLGNSTASGIHGGLGGLRLNDSVGAGLDYNGHGFIIDSYLHTYGTTPLQSDAQISSTIASGSVAFQALTGAKLALGTSGTATIAYDGTSNISSVGYGAVRQLLAPTTPTITGFTGTGAAVSASNGSNILDINVGTVAPGSGGTITLPAATTGWECRCRNWTVQHNGVALLTQIISTADTATTCAIQQVTTATGAAANFAASDHIRCTAFPL